MIFFPGGITITEVEHQSLLHVETNPEQWLLNTLAEKAALRRNALIAEWEPRLFADPSVITLPADTDDLIALILARSDYQTRLEADATLRGAVAPIPQNMNRFNAQGRPGTTVTLLVGGIFVPDQDARVMLAYLQDIEDWIMGALLGHINRGKKKMLAQYLPVLRADPLVTTIPANESGLIAVITARPDYRSTPTGSRP